MQNTIGVKRLSVSSRLNHIMKGLLNDTHMEELRALLKKFIEIQGWLLLTFFICLHNQLILLSYRCLKNMIYQVGSKNEWLLLSVTFTAKLELVFVLTFENAFC